MESHGVRWAADFGMQDYESLESKGIRLFGRTQDAERWKVFRLNNYVHNTLTIDNQLQLVKGYARIDRHSDKAGFAFAISDISSVYENQIAAAKRGVAIVDGKYVVVRDELETLDKPATIRWTMLTPAVVEVAGNNTATLTKDGKQLTLSVDTKEDIKIKTWSTTPTTDYDAANPGTTLVGFEVQVPAAKKVTFTVTLIPQAAEKITKKETLPLKDWR
jgi:hypothetical protein